MSASGQLKHKYTHGAHMYTCKSFYFHSISASVILSRMPMPVLCLSFAFPLSPTCTHHFAQSFATESISGHFVGFVCVCSSFSFLLLLVVVVFRSPLVAFRLIFSFTLFYVSQFIHTYTYMRHAIIMLFEKDVNVHISHSVQWLMAW